MANPSQNTTSDSVRCELDALEMELQQYYADADKEFDWASFQKTNSNIAEINSKNLRALERDIAQAENPEEIERLQKFADKHRKIQSFLNTIKNTDPTNGAGSAPSQ